MSTTDSSTPLVEFNQKIECLDCTFYHAAASDKPLLGDLRHLDECPECGGDIIHIEPRSFAF